MFIDQLPFIAAIMTLAINLPHLALAKDPIFEDFVTVQ
jgi:hypothetical protein